MATAAYLIVMMFDGNIIPVGKIYYSLREARQAKEKIGVQSMPTIIRVSPGQPPMATQ